MAPPRFHRPFAAILGLSALVAPACTARNPDYCDEQTACGGGLACDLPRNRCIEAAPPECIGAPDCLDPAAPLCVDGVCGQCRTGSDCSPDAPRCTGSPEHVCAACAESVDCAVYAGTPVCGPEGACVGCATEADCPAGDACSAALGECQPCAANQECEGRICQLEDGACLDPGQVVYLDPEGVDEAGCGPTAPCATLSFALTYLAAGRPYLHLAAGTYVDSIELGAVDAVIVAAPGAELRGASSDRPVLALRGGQIRIEGLRVVGHPASTTVGIEVTGGNHRLSDLVVEGSGASGISVSAGDVALTDVRSTDNGTHGLSVRGGGAAVVRAALTDNGGAGLFLTGGEVTLEASTVASNRSGGVVARDASLEVVNSFVHHNTSTAFAPVHFSTSSTSGTARVVHTTIVANLSGSDEAGGILCGGAFDVTVRNDIIQGNQGPDAAVTGCDVTHSLLGPTIQAGAGNILGTPRFVDLDGGDLHLVPDSVGVDDGTSGDADVDADGDPRPTGAAPDMGADEVVPGSAAAGPAESTRRGMGGRDHEHR